MLSWTVHTLNATVEAELDALPTDMRARLTRLVETIETFGLERLGMPHVRHLEGKLWEMRLTGRDGIARAIYVTASGQRVVIVHAFVKKAQRTPQAALALARRRAKEVT
jgi:phage-related protein